MEKYHLCLRHIEVNALSEKYTRIYFVQLVCNSNGVRQDFYIINKPIPNSTDFQMSVIRLGLTGRT